MHTFCMCSSKDVCRSAVLYIVEVDLNYLQCLAVLVGVSIISMATCMFAHISHEFDVILKFRCDFAQFAAKAKVLKDIAQIHTICACFEDVARFRRVFMIFE